MWTEQQIREHNRRIAAAEAEARAALSNAKPERYQAPPLERPTPRAAPCLGQITVRFTGRRVGRLLDADNFAASIKDLLDGLVHSQLLPDDDPSHIRLETSQELVSQQADMTIIEIEYPPGYQPFT